MPIVTRSSTSVNAALDFGGQCDMCCSLTRPSRRRNGEAVDIVETKSMLINFTPGLGFCRVLLNRITPKPFRAAAELGPTHATEAPPDSGAEGSPSDHHHQLLVSFPNMIGNSLCSPSV